MAVIGLMPFLSANQRCQNAEDKCRSTLIVKHCLDVLNGKLFEVYVVQRVATNLENLEYSGISVNLENSGKSM